MNVTYYLMTAEASQAKRREFDLRVGLVEPEVDDRGRPVPVWYQLEGEERIDPAAWTASL